MGKPTTSDVVVIGGGIVGASLAYELSVAGLTVTLFEGELPGRASDAGAGIASPQTSHDPDADWYRFGAAALEHLRQLVPRLGEDGVALGADSFSECGSLVLALAEHEDPWFEEARQLVTERDEAVAEVSPSQARALFPPLGRPWRALYCPGSARVDGRRWAAGLRQAAARRGVTTLTERVTGLVRRHDDLTVDGAGTAVGCARVVLANGAWSAPLARHLGVDLPVSPTKGEIVHLEPIAADDEEPQCDRWPIVQPILNFYLVPWPHGRVACGGTFEPQAGFDVRPTAGGVRDLLRECLTIAPGLAGAAVLETRVGLRPTTPDDRPLLGPLPGASSVLACTGHGANGLLLGPYSASLVAEALVTERMPGALAPFSPRRFADQAAPRP